MTHSDAHHCTLSQAQAQSIKPHWSKLCSSDSYICIIHAFLALCSAHCDLSSPWLVIFSWIEIALLISGFPRSQRSFYAASQRTPSTGSKKHWFIWFCRNVVNSSIVWQWLHSSLFADWQWWALPLSELMVEVYAFRLQCSTSGTFEGVSVFLFSAHQGAIQREILELVKSDKHHRWYMPWVLLTWEFLDKLYLKLASSSFEIRPISHCSLEFNKIFLFQILVSKKAESRCEMAMCDTYMRGIFIWTFPWKLWLDNRLQKKSSFLVLI